MSERQLKHVKLTGEWLTGLVTDGNELHMSVTEGVPEDAEFRRVEYDSQLDAYMLVVWSDAFDPVPEGRPIPEVESLTFTELDCADD